MAPGARIVRHVDFIRRALLHRLNLAPGRHSYRQVSLLFFLLLLFGFFPIADRWIGPTTFQGRKLCVYMIKVFWEVKRTGPAGRADSREPRPILVQLTLFNDDRNFSFSFFPHFSDGFLLFYLTRREDVLYVYTQEVQLE